MARWLSRALGLWTVNLTLRGWVVRRFSSGNSEQSDMGASSQVVSCKESVTKGKSIHQ